MRSLWKRVFALRLAGPDVGPDEARQGRRKIEFNACLRECKERVASVSLLFDSEYHRDAKIILEHLALDFVNAGLFAYDASALASLEGWREALEKTGDQDIAKSIKTVVFFALMSKNDFREIGDIRTPLERCYCKVSRLKNKFQTPAADAHRFVKNIRLCVLSLALVLLCFSGYWLYQYIGLGYHIFRATEAWNAGDVTLACNDMKEVLAIRDDDAVKDRAKQYCDGKDVVEILLKQGEDDLRSLDMQKVQSILEAGKQINALAFAGLEGKANRSLWAIDRALAAYRARNGAYPPGTGPEGNFDKDMKFKEDWIAGLAPEYIDKLPRDPRVSDSKNDQYYYWSDGKDYKLVRHGVPDDCKFVKSRNPALVDPVRDCWAYGYWTPNAAKW
ncbi:MAG: hypothetical protein HQK81_08600 [Desulfovibrionaceae bacterium]|nr:hypothetical protein [Desulfovibrionaceae bacterium]MBF0514109.1 hypothetical protein [Desulfovibrionaceae bacterium]